MKTSAPLTSLPLKSLLTTALALGAASASASRAEAAYVQTNLVSNIPGLATISDPNLVNPWGVSYFGASPFWVSNQGSATSTLYAVTGSTTVSKEFSTVGNPLDRFSRGSNRAGRQYKHVFVSGRKRRQWRSRAFHFRQSERLDLGLGCRHDGVYPGDRSGRLLYRPCHQPG